MRAPGASVFTPASSAAVGVLGQNLRDLRRRGTCGRKRDGDLMAMPVGGREGSGRGDRGERVAECDVMEADAASNRPRIQAHRVRCVDDLWIHFEVLEDAVEQRQRALDLHLYVEQLAEREEEPALERREGDDVADRR